MSTMISEFCRTERHSECHSENCACYCHDDDRIGTALRAVADEITVTENLVAILERVGGAHR